MNQNESDERFTEKSAEFLQSVFFINASLVSTTIRKELITRAKGGSGAGAAMGWRAEGEMACAPQRAVMRNKVAGSHVWDVLDCG